MPPDPLAALASGAHVPPQLYYPCYGTGVHHKTVTYHDVDAAKDTRKE